MAGGNSGYVDWTNPFTTLRKKWREVPAGEQGRATTSELLTLNDDELQSRWIHARKESSTGDAYGVRGWYHELYRDVLKGKNVLDVGSGFGIDGITFAESGARVTFLDIVEDNLSVLRRLCLLREVSNVSFKYLESLESLASLPADFDVIWCQGSLINAPFDVVRREIQELLKHLKIGGRWIELAYPKVRWEREGCLPFEEWGTKTDGGAPWIEWYDLDKLTRALAPAKFEKVLYFDFHNSDFNWFDLVRLS